MANFFDDVFDNKIFFEKEDLLKTFNEKNNETKKISQQDMSNDTLEDIMQRQRENPERHFTEKESKIIKEKLKEVIELKRVIELSESLDVIEGVVEDGNI